MEETIGFQRSQKVDVEALFEFVERLGVLGRIVQTELIHLGVFEMGHLLELDAEIVFEPVVCHVPAVNDRLSVGGARKVDKKVPGDKSIVEVADALSRQGLVGPERLAATKASFRSLRDAVTQFVKGDIRDLCPEPDGGNEKGAVEHAGKNERVLEGDALIVVAGMRVVG
jgi:hypothetical protein